MTLHTEVGAPGEIQEIRRLKFHKEWWLEWDLEEKVVPFVAHVVPGNSALLMSRSDLKELQLHLDNPRTTLNVSTTSAGHYEIDLLNRAKGLAAVCSSTEMSGDNGKVLARNNASSRFFFERSGPQP